jgi:putative ATPase
VIAPLLSRCRVLTLNMLTDDEIGAILNRALRDEERGIGKLGIELDSEALDYLIHNADGDARAALNGLDIAAALRAGEGKTEVPITLPDVERAIQKKALMYDKSGEEHYNLISALHKSLRGSDPDAALYWLARMLEAGEDPLFIARRMIRFASEDVGNADPRALGIAIDAMEAYKFIGRPEGDLALAQAAVYLATASKSNRLYTAYKAVVSDIRSTGSQPVPLHIRNAPTRLMKDLGYSEGYKYAHDYPDAHVPQDYLPDGLKGRRYYRPTDRGYEKIISERIERWRRSMRPGRKRD